MAITNTAVWEIRTTGNAANGGFYAGGGTDYSQQDSAQLSLTDGVSVGTTTITSATGGFTAAMVGNGINIAGVFRQITVRNSTNSIDVDDNVSIGTGLSMKVGGAVTNLDTFNSNATQGNTAFVKSGNYTTTTGYNITVGGSGNCDSLMQVIGYNTNRVRGNTDTQPVIKPGAGSITLLTVNCNFTLVNNLKFDGSGQSDIKGLFIAGGAAHQVEHCNATSCSNNSFELQTDRTHCIDCYATLNSGGFAFQGNANQVFDGCIADANTTGGFHLDFGMAINCISCNNTGSNPTGFIETARGTYINCTAYNNSDNGFLFDNAQNSLAQNCVAVNNGIYGFSNPNPTNAMWYRSCASYNNASGNNFTGSYQTGFQTLSGDPFTSAATGDFSLNNTAGAGASCRAAGMPGTFNSLTTTGYADIGAVQHQDAGGTTNNIFIVGDG